MRTELKRCVSNNVRVLREEKLLSKAELARRAGLSALTIDRVENGMPCRMDTMRKIILALELSLEDKDLVFGNYCDITSGSAPVGAAAGGGALSQAAVRPL